MAGTILVSSKILKCILLLLLQQLSRCLLNLTTLKGCNKNATVKEWNQGLSCKLWTRYNLLLTKEQPIVFVVVTLIALFELPKIEQSILSADDQK